MKEIITLQCGQRSNYLATHFWNLQESYFGYSDSEQLTIDHNVHFRSGIGVDGTDTFTPRTVIYDLKGGFGSLRKYNALYELSDETVVPSDSWQGNATTQKQPVIEANEYQQKLDQGHPTPQLTEGQVRYWSDFNRVYYHPRSIVQLSEYELNSQLMPFENWNAGQDLFEHLDRESDLVDRDVRPFAEECDNLAGIQLFTCSDDAWGGFASGYVEELRDEFGKTSIWLWGQEDGRRHDLKAQGRRTANVAKSLQAMAPQLSAYIRLSSLPGHVPSYANLTSDSEWSMSALLCTAIETMTLPTRLQQGRGRLSSLAEMEGILNQTGSRTIFELQASVIPRNGKEQDSSFHEERSTSGLRGTQMTSQLDVDYSPNARERTLGQGRRVFSRLETQRCIPDCWPFMSDGRPEHEGRLEIYPTDVPFPRLDTFPSDLFVGTEYKKVGIRASLATTSETQPRLKTIAQSVQRTVAVEDRENLLNDLAELAEAYTEGWDSSSDTGSDG